MPESYEQRIDLPGDLALWFIEEHPTDPRLNHSYWAHNAETGKKGRRLAGVTTVCKPLDYDPENLLKWAARKQCEGVAQLYLATSGQEYHHWLTSAEEMWAELNRHNLTYKDVRQKAGDEGTNVHRLAFEELAAGRPGLNFDGLSPREMMLSAAVSAFWFDHDPNASHVEQVVYSERLRVAGRLDFRGRLNKECNRPTCACHKAKGPGVVDLKTGGFISASAHTQVGGGYPLLSGECGVGEADWAAILQVFDDGHYEFFPAEGTPAGFEKAAETYREAGRINGAAKKARDARLLEAETQAEIDDALKAVSA
jgi:hypothetical protein